MKKDMRHILSFLVLSLLLTACDDTSGEFSLCGDGFCSREVFSNSAIETVQVSPDEMFANIVAGDKIVFRRTYVSIDDKKIADDELTETLLFQIDKDIDAFSWKDEELADAGVLFGRLCYCYPHGYAPVTTGVLEGTRIAQGVWRIHADLEADDAVSSLKFELIFD